MVGLQPYKKKQDATNCTTSERLFANCAARGNTDSFVKTQLRFFGSHFVHSRDDFLSLLRTGDHQIQHTDHEPDARYTQGKVCLLTCRTARDDSHDEDGQHQDDVADQSQYRQERVFEEAEINFTGEATTVSAQIKP